MQKYERKYCIIKRSILKIWIWNPVKWMCSFTGLIYFHNIVSKIMLCIENMILYRSSEFPRGYLSTTRIDNTESALLPDERIDLISTNRLGHGWAYVKPWPISKPSSELAAVMAVIDCLSRSCCRYVDNKAVFWTSWLIGLRLLP